MATCYTLKGSARGKLESSAGAEPWGGGYGPTSGQGSATHPATGTVTSEDCYITTSVHGGVTGWSRLCLRSHWSVSTLPYFPSPGAHLQVQV